jgi:ribosomal protein S18 acetylase RimI-like enzyme
MTDASAVEPIIRPYREDDRADCFDVCVRTAAVGADARGHYSSDALMGDLFFGPYVDLDPALAFVVATGQHVLGYVVATADTREFVRRYRSELLPEFARRYPLVDPASGPEAFMISLGHDPERLLLPVVDAYPAHLHIDLLPEVQGRGLGRRLIDTERSALAARGVPAVHLSMMTANRAARAFYDRLGFVELAADENTETLGLATG